MPNKFKKTPKRGKKKKKGFLHAKAVTYRVNKQDASKERFVIEKDLATH